MSHKKNLIRLLLILGTLVALTAASLALFFHHKHSAITAQPQWVDQSVSFQADGMTIYGTYRHDAHASTNQPAALLIAGSGPTDRDGNSKLIKGKIDTIKTVADWLSDDGVASLRYDKLASGQTGLGKYANDPKAITFNSFQLESVAALEYLAHQPHIDTAKLSVFGHSEGGLLALLLANGIGAPAGATIHNLHTLGLLEPLSQRDLTTYGNQLIESDVKAVAVGQITQAQKMADTNAIIQAVQSLRATGQAPVNLPTSLQSSFGGSTGTYLAQADKYDPAILASELNKSIAVIISCSDDDIQITCPQVNRVVTSLHHTGIPTDFVQQKGIDHVLKQDTSQTGEHYADPLPFSSQLRSQLKTFAQEHITK